MKYEPSQKGRSTLATIRGLKNKFGFHSGERGKKEPKIEEMEAYLDHTRSSSSVGRDPNICAM